MTTTSLVKIIESKRALRREFAMLPIVEKLRMLEMMLERELAIRSVKILRQHSQRRARNSRS
jgi:hypothetical protein